MPKVVDVAARRAELATAAARLIARSGLEAATLREVAAEAGLTTGALTHYFADKRELLLFTYRRSLEQRQLERAERPAGQPADELRTALEDALPTDETSLLHWKVTIALSAQAGDDETLREVQRTAYRAHLDRTISRLANAGHGTARTRPTLADQLISVTNGIAIQVLFDPERWPPTRQLATLHAAIAAILSTA